ncbi:MAG: N-acetylmuramoyl-L-alanine amidase [Hyphomicrobiaceae bacterium]
MRLARDSDLVADLCPSPCFEPRRGSPRPDILLLHYTGMTSCERAIDWLSRPDSRLSCHYVIDLDGRITQMVAESERAWHAGVSQWAGETDINSRSVGFEIHNGGHDHGYPEFPEAQMAAVIALAADVVRRWSISPERVLGHADVAPARKSDPGEKFDWQRLAAAGVGLWVPPAPPDECEAGYGRDAANDVIAHAQRLFARYGYGVELTGLLDKQTELVIIAFQRHFRPTRVDGRLDASTVATLERLVAALDR